ncbi:MAG: hypothetical protein MJY71_06205 [Bacteroidaceae bacterium]|nr:hypothetical protein [Bacteroidaceae bacterium]
MKKTLILATGVIVAMASCTKETFVGQTQGSTQTPIVFGSTNSAVTKTATSNDAPAVLLGNSFVVYGWKETGVTKSVVFDHYNVEFVQGTENSTESNLKGWEYVAITPVNGTNKTEVTGTSWTAVTQQTIKFWDKKADKYKFIAFSRGKGANNNFASFSTIDTSKVGTADPVYTVTGTSDELAAVYIANMDSISGTDNYSRTKPVTPQFKSIGAKIRVAFYETVPGYSVDSLTFLDKDNNPSTDNKVMLYANDGEGFPDEGSLEVYIDNKGIATATYKANVGATTTQNLTFSNSITLKEARESAEPEGNKYMGRSSSKASYSAPDSAYMFQLPNTGVELNLNVQYTLVSTDGKGEKIEVGPVSVIIPKVYTKWQSNYAYTYIFKISEKSGNLEPITFDAVVTDTQDGVQETVTALQTGPLTTYAKGVNPTTNSEYKKNSNIYIGHKDPKYNFDDGGKLYTVNVESGACQDITEGSFANTMALINNNGANVFATEGVEQVASVDVGTSVSENYKLVSSNEYIHCASGEVAVEGETYYTINDEKISAWIIKDANGKKMTIAKASCPLTIVSAIPAADAPDGKTAISGHFGTFTPSTAGIYAFAYADGTAYKIINVVE